MQKLSPTKGSEVMIMGSKRPDRNELLQQALPLEDDEDDQDNECYEYLRGVRDEAKILDQQIEEQKNCESKRIRLIEETTLIENNLRSHMFL